MQSLPKARSENILVQETGREVMIYDTKTDKALCLNETCAVVFNHCDGKTTFDDLKRGYRLTDDVIYFALGELRRVDLVGEVESGYFGNLTRREIVRRVGLSAMVAIPLITGLAAPKAAHAASVLLRNGSFCSANNQCASNRCGENGFGVSCCSSNNFAACSSSADCCSGVICSNNVCCQNAGRVCDTRSNTCCAGLRCIPGNGISGNGTCQV